MDASKTDGIDLHIYQDKVDGDFLKDAVASFVDAMDSLLHDINGECRWLFSVRSGSTVVEAVLDDEVEPTLRAGIMDEVDDMLSDLAQDVEPKIVSIDTVRRFSKLARVIGSSNDPSASLDIRTRSGASAKVVPFERFAKVGMAAKRPPELLSVSSVEGTVKGIHGAREHYLDLYDDLTSDKVKVSFDETFADDFLGTLYMKHVRVVGVSSHDTGGTRKIRASRISLSPARNDVPRWSDLIGILEG